jgi:hypothetical protein
MAWIWRSFLLKSDGCAEQEEKSMASREYLSLGEIANLVGLGFDYRVEWLFNPRHKKA